MLEKYKGIKYTCPHCGQKTFTRYVDTFTNQVIADDCGRCDREISCKFHRPPREYFALNPTAYIPSPNPALPSEPQPQPDVVNFGEVHIWDSRRRGNEHYESDFAVGLSQYFNEATVHSMIDTYHLQANGKQRNTMFPNIDKDGVVQDIAVIGYAPDLHRNGVAYHYRGNDKWKAKMEAEHPNGYKYGFCYFGEHLLPLYPDTPIALVESQKTAVICSAIHPCFIWLATCGSNQYKPEYCKPFKRRKVMVYPDKGCEAKWQAVTDRLVSEGYDIKLTPIMQQTKGYADNSDIADVLLDGMKICKKVH